MGRISKGIYRTIKHNASKARVREYFIANNSHIMANSMKISSMDRANNDQKAITSEGRIRMV